MTMAGADQGGLDQTRAEAERLGVIDRITFPGYIDQAGKQAAFADHDIFLNTNRIDNMPVSLLEAAASGLVPVATEVGGIPSLLTDGHDALLVPSEDDEAMAAAVQRLFDDADGYAKMSAAARRLAERSSWPAVRERWREELTYLLPDLEMP
jgi:glycosyltransferase involved in cell wall biosynthesis